MLEDNSLKLNTVKLFELANFIKRSSSGDLHITDLYRDYKIFHNKIVNDSKNRTEKELLDLGEQLGEAFHNLAVAFIDKAVTDPDYVEPAVEFLRALHGLAENKRGLTLIKGGKGD